VGLDELADMQRSHAFGLHWTPHTKIKVDDDVPRLRRILAALLPCKPAAARWTVDANSAWSPSVTRHALEVMTQAGDHVCVIEQPFPVAFKQQLKQEGGGGAEAREWEQVAAECARAGVDVYADESVCTVDDVQLLQPYVHGVNVKMDKAGGFRGAVCALHAAKQLGLKTWVGMMVCNL